MRPRGGGCAIDRVGRRGRVKRDSGGPVSSNGLDVDVLYRKCDQGQGWHKAMRFDVGEWRACALVEGGCAVAKRAQATRDGKAEVSDVGVELNGTRGVKLRTVATVVWSR